MMTTNKTRLSDILDDVWDTRDLIELIDYLEGIDDPDEDEVEELRRALELQAELEPYAPDYRYGEAVIADYHFRQYAEELADDLGLIDGKAGWPNSYIDWERAADALKMDYTGVEFEGKTWWVR